MNEALTFEAAVAELERILRCLEDGSTTLDECLAQYERGVGLLKLCYAQLQSAEHRISLLAGVDENGKPIIQPFDHAASDGAREEKARRRAQLRSTDGTGLY